MIGEVVSHYRILERLGGGGMGVVYEAEDLHLGRRVALKFLPDSLARDPQVLERFQREARAASALNHPHICTIHEITEHEGRPVLVMERMQGRTLKHRLEGKPLTLAEVAALGDQIADALEAAHRAGIIHRDLKPANVFVTDHGEAKLLDFGLAKQDTHAAVGSDSHLETAVVPDHLTTPGMLLGTVAYMSPEQAQGLPVDARSDLFSFGILLYEMATGRHPFPGENSVSILSSILRDTPPPLSRILPSAPAAVDRIIRRCLAKNPADRYASAAGLRRDLQALRAELAPASTRRPRIHPVLFAAVALLLVILGGWWFRRSAQDRWVRKTGLPQLESLVERIQFFEEGRESWDAFLLARKLEAMNPGDPLVVRLRPKFTREITLTSEPSGAEVYARYYDEPNSAPILLGRTPLEHVAFPRGFIRISLVLPGYETGEDLGAHPLFMGTTWHYRLQPPGKLPAGMAYIPEGSDDLLLPGLGSLKKESTAAFLMDRHEVTNREFKRFVAAGAYTDPKYWHEPFQSGGHTIPLREALARFTDRTGRPGPATWELGTYPEGHGDYPVSGLSWYEAAAYAAWAGKRLPTVFHWNRVALTGGSARIVPMANLGKQGPVPVGTTQCVSRFGVSDLAGNVREWIWNQSGKIGDRFILGGGWNDPDYAFNDPFAQPAFDRSPTNGFRCIQLLDAEPSLASLERSLDRPSRNFRKERPVSDAVFAQFLRQFAYDRIPLAAKIEEESQTPDGLRQKITFSAAYGGERMMAYLFLPKTSRPPYQVVVVFPGSGSIDIRSSANLDLGRADFFQKSGRAVLWPIYKGTYERGGDLHDDHASETASYRDYVVMWEKDLARSIDYLESRSDLDASRLTYYGLSWGGEMGGIMPAVEKRIKVNILYVAGLSFQRARPEADAINYLGRVKQPTLMLNGEFDFFFPAETSQKPMFDLLGVPAGQKKRLTYPNGHSVPRTELIKEALAWVDHYLGPVATSPGG